METLDGPSLWCTPVLSISFGHERSHLIPLTSSDSPFSILSGTGIMSVASPAF